ncbi:MAG: protein kinase, partial [Planctomycetota bacterium]|nr:protein kinase [Planctomycetota bacterium]
MTADNGDGFDLRSSAEYDQDGLNEILSGYIDRLNGGEVLNLRKVQKEYPELANEIWTRLEVYQEVGGQKVPDHALGTLGDYTLRRQIGRGGMGVVYEAWQGSMNRQVALKVLPAGIAADRRACARFMREAQTAGQLHHENVVRVYSTGVEEGTPWYSMEYVEGETLAQVLAKIREAEEDVETVFGNKDRAGYFEKLVRCFADVA